MRNFFILPEIKLLMGVLLFLSFPLFISAQNGTVQGTVKDANGQPVAGASVILDGTKKGTTSDAAGNYTFQVAPGKHTLVISYVGTESQRKEITVSANENIVNDFQLVNTGRFECGRGSGIQIGKFQGQGW